MDDRQRLEILRNLLTTLTHTSDRTALLMQIMQQAVESIEAAGAGDIFLWDETMQCLTPHAWYNLGDWIRHVRLRPGEGVAGTAAQRREGVLVNDYAQSAFASAHFTRRLTHTAVMAVPMLCHDMLLGAITVGNEGTGQPFSAGDLQILTVFAVLATMALGRTH